MKKILFLAMMGLAACTTVRESTQLEGERVFFGYDSADISAEANQNLLGQSLYMKNNPGVDVVIEGHCDERGSSEYNLVLGALRAGNAAHVLMKDGIEKERIRTISYGKEKPQFLGTGESVWSRNRNATTRVVE